MSRSMRQPSRKASEDEAESPRSHNCSGHAQAPRHLSGDQKYLIRYNPSICPRSSLFIPGHKPRALKKALGTVKADCFILDLEDSVGPGSKREAREGIRHFLEVELEEWKSQRELEREEMIGVPCPDENLASGSVVETHSITPLPRFIVRINSPDDDMPNALLDLDLVGELGDRIEGIGIPKISTESFEKIRDQCYPKHTLWAFFETPQSILDAAKICRSKKFKAAVMGYNDLATELQLPSSSIFSSSVSNSSASRLAESSIGSSAHKGILLDSLNEHERELLYTTSRYPLWWSAMSVLVAARSADSMFFLDGVFNDPTDPTGFQRDLNHCVALGFHGKTLIHPSQVPPTNAIFSPREEDVEWAIEVEAAVAASKGNVATVRGKMIEGLHARQAQRILQLHRNAEVEQKESQASNDQSRSGKESTKSTRSSPPSRHRKAD